MATKELAAAIALKLKDGFSQGIGKAADASDRFAGKTIGAVNRVDKAFSGIATKIGAIGVTLSLGAAAKSIITMDHRMTRLGLTANASAEQVSKMKRAIFDVAQASDVKLDPTNILAGLEVVMTKTGDLKYAEANIRNIALAIQASGESGDAIGDVFSEFAKAGYTAEAISRLMDDMVAQSDKGEFTFAEFAKNAKGVISAYSAIGNAPEDIKRANAAMQVLTAGTKSSEVATTVLNSAINELRDPAKRKEIEKLGIQVRSAADPTKLRDFNEIMADLAAASEDVKKMDIINSLFGSEALKAISAYGSEFGKNYKQLLDLGDTTGLLQQKASTMAGTLQSNITNLQTAFLGFADSNLTKPLEHITNLLNKMAEDPKRFEAVFDAIGRGVLIIAGLKIGAGIMSFLSTIRDFQKGNGSVKVTEELTMGKTMPVYVTNWGGAASGPIGAAGMPGAGTGGLVDQYGNPLSPSVTNTPGPATQTPPANTSKWKLNKPNMKGALKAGAGAAAVTAVMSLPGFISELGEISANEELTKAEREKAKGGAIGEFAGSVGGAAAGAIAGAAIGSVVPVVGTALGALVGGLIGQFGGPVGRVLGEKIGAAVSKINPEEAAFERARAEYEDAVHEASNTTGKTGVEIERARQLVLETEVRLEEAKKDLEESQKEELRIKSAEAAFERARAEYEDAVHDAGNIMGKTSVEIERARQLVLETAARMEKTKKDLEKELRTSPAEAAFERARAEHEAAVHEAGNTTGKTGVEIERARQLVLETAARLEEAKKKWEDSQKKEFQMKNAAAHVPAQFQTMPEAAKTGVQMPAQFRATPEGVKAGAGAPMPAQFRAMPEAAKTGGAPVAGRPWAAQYRTPASIGAASEARADTEPVPAPPDGPAVAGKPWAAQYRTPTSIGAASEARADTEPVPAPPDGPAVAERPWTGRHWMPASLLPPQITQTKTEFVPLKAELAGQAAIDVNVNLNGERPTVQAGVRNNGIPNMRLTANTGHAPWARNMAL